MKKIFALTLLLLASPAHAAEGLYPGCAWIDQEVTLFGQTREKIGFARQFCVDPTLKVGYRLTDENQLIETINQHERTVAQFWPLDKEFPESRITSIAKRSVKPEEAGKCEVVADKNGQYRFAPKADYLAQLLAADEPYYVCGAFGDTNDSIRYFTVIEGRVLAFIEAGQELPLFNPASFAFNGKSR